MRHFLFLMLLVLLVVGGFFEKSYQQVISDEAYLQAAAVVLSRTATTEQHNTVLETEDPVVHDLLPRWQREQALRRATAHDLASQVSMEITDEPDSYMPTEAQSLEISHTEPVSHVLETERVQHVSVEIVETPTVETPALETPPDNSLVSLIHTYTNEVRIKEGLTPLSYSYALSRIGSLHSSDMVARDFFSHENPDGCTLTCRFSLAAFPAYAWAENIVVVEHADMLTDEEIARQVIASWLASGPHRENILSSTYTHEGIGIAEDGDTVYVTVDFALLK